MVSNTAGARAKLALVVNGPSEFWTLAEAGVRKAQQELPDFDLRFECPERAEPEIQQRLLEALVTDGAAAVAVSILDIARQIDDLEGIAARVPLFTFDSDPPGLSRVAYIGSSNDELGRKAGEIAIQALPRGGKMVGFVGDAASENARQRIEAFRETVGPYGIELLEVRNDDHEQDRARANVLAVLREMPAVDGLVGFYSYNPPRIYEALREAGELGRRAVVAFDEHPITLSAVEEGVFAGTVVQQPFVWSYVGMKLMAAHVRGEGSTTPAGRVIIPGIVVTRDNIEQFRSDLLAKLEWR